MQILDDADPYCDNVLEVLIGTCHINGLTPPKLQGLVHTDIPALNQ